MKMIDQYSKNLLNNEVYINLRDQGFFTADLLGNQNEYSVRKNISFNSLVKLFIG